MSASSLRPMRPIQRSPLVEEVLPVHSPDAAKKPAKPAPSPTKPCGGFGLNTPANEKEFTAGFKKLQTAWPKLTSAQRRQQMETLVNTQLGKGGVPQVGIVPKVLANDNGQMDFTKWKLFINKNLLDTNALSEAKAKELANTVYHESRHAEQWYLMAQEKAAELAKMPGQKETPAQQAQAIQTAIGIPAGTAQTAQKHPLAATDGRKPCAQALNTSVYGANAAHRGKTLTGLDKSGTALKQAQAHFDNLNHAYEKLRVNPLTNPTVLKAAYDKAVAAVPPLTAANATFQKYYKLYRQLPEEADAWETGDAAEHVYK